MAVNLLLSYAFHAKTDLRAIRRSLVCGRLLIDSGAFTAWTKGQPIALDAYAEYLEAWSTVWDHAITLDVIGNPDATAANTRKLHERGLPVMPVFTRGNSLADFDAMVRDVGYVCVGGLVGLSPKAQRARVGMLQRRAADGGGGIHALGIGSLETLRGARPYSADASNISSTFKYGCIAYFDGKRIRSVSLKDTKQLTRDREHIRAHGIDLGPLARTGRMPSNIADRAGLMRAMSLAYAAADEHLKATRRVEPPRAVTDAVGTHLFSSASAQFGREASFVAELDRDLHTGTHLYSSVVADTYAADVAAVDHQVHDGAVPLLWRRYAPRHADHCRYRSPSRRSATA
ncbi:MAG: hypothetical protein GEU83_11940 [Pseudonocardiaceae bacterium]|nr:hypothetical protein [Pseudonocardiaceae bacterium]